VSGVETRAVAEAEEGIRLDRWFRRHFPNLGHGHLEKLLRTGQVRIDGRRAKANTRLEPGQTIRVPPLGPAGASRSAAAAPPRPKIRDADVQDLHAAILYQDDDVIAIDKAAGLAVQGGTGTHRHLDGMLDALRFEASDRPRLVHRLDRDTSGVLLIARTVQAASELAAAFKAKTARKVYWAAVTGVPKPRAGTIDMALEKQGSPRGERVAPDEEGRRAVTRYRVVDHAGDRFSWLVMEPLTGRTHQLRVHAAAIGTPILGDPKYAERAQFPTGSEGIARKLHLHARAIRIPRPRGKILEVTAPLPPHMKATWAFLGFDESAERDPFAD
jgi:23S rRNA pseudouridine955/2504/2580 synthase